MDFRCHAWAPEDKTSAGAVENMRRLGLIRPRDLVPSPSLGASGSVVESSQDCGWSLAIAGVQRTGAVCRASVHWSRVCGGRACSVSNAILTIRKVPGWHVCVVPRATGVAVHAVLVVLPHWWPPCSDDPVSTSDVSGPWSLAAWSREGRRDAARIAPSCICKDGPPACWREVFRPRRRRASLNTF